MKSRMLLAAALFVFPTDPAPESRIAPPDRDDAAPEVYVDESSTGGRGDYTVSTTPGIGVTGFEFTNHGGNRVLPVRERGIGLGPLRQFSFDFRTRARQDIHFSITDSPTEYLSHRMESYFYLFPRRVLPAIVWPEPGTGAKTFTVVLPTEERVEFDAATMEVVSGVLRETAPVDLGPDRFKRKFAAVEYSGTGVILRVDRRGADPRLGTTATVRKGAQSCKVPSALLFDQNPESAVLFRFATDEAFDVYLKKQCKFGLL